MENEQTTSFRLEPLDQAVAEGGAYEVLHKRLLEQGQRLSDLARALNERRLKEFGASPQEVIGRVRIHTGNNCVARDIVRVGADLLFGYNVFIGLRKETRVEDVFSLYRLVEGDSGYEADPRPLEGSFLADATFVRDFRELYAYYKNTRLLQLAVRNGRLLASFQIGERVGDIRVFRWSISDDEREVRYIDNRGERDIALPAQFDFEWQRTSPDMFVQGRHPHINIEDAVFVETIGGDLTIKIENNTEVGQGIYSEKVDDQNQALDDAQVEYARLGSLVLLKVLPYREQQWRYLVYNTLTQKAARIDAIGQACQQLPQDHGIIFPGGYYLQNGEFKTFDQPMQGMHFKRMVRSPNGEDVLYIFYHPEDGRVVLLTYNLISRQLQTPIIGQGYARLHDGRLIIFHTESDEPTRLHPMQIWQSPFCTDEYAAQQPVRQGFFGRVGNAELVRGISDLLNLWREISAPGISVQRYTQLCQATRRLADTYHWIEDKTLDGLAVLLREINATAGLVLDEFAKVESIRAQSAQELASAQAQQTALLTGLRTQHMDSAQAHVQALGRISAQRGLLLTIRERRYIDTDRIDALEAELLEENTRIGNATAQFLASDDALQPWAQEVQALDAQAQKAATMAELRIPLDALAAMAADLDMLTSLVPTLQMDDATQRTRIIDAISGVYAHLNQTKARAAQHGKTLGSSEAVAQFGAQFRLFGQSMSNALAQATDPEKCDEQLSRLLVQLEELESQFGEHEQFLGDILGKREELLETFEAHRQVLLDDRQRRAQGLQDAALRILQTLDRRTARFAEAQELNAFFVADPLILKLRELTQRLRELGDSVRADDVEARLKGARDQAMRSLRDKSELFESGGSVIRLGPRHRFSVNTQELDLTLLPRGDQLNLHLSGTDFLEPLADAELQALSDYWHVSVESETPQLYRGEYLAGEVLAAARERRDGLSLDALHQLLPQPGALERAVREFAAPRYRDGYERGIHDHDAARILEQLLPLTEAAGLLRFTPLARALGVLYLHWQQPEVVARLWPQRARTGRHVQQLFGRAEGQAQLQDEIVQAMQEFARLTHFPTPPQAVLEEAAQYLVQLLAQEHPQVLMSKYGQQIRAALQDRLQGASLWAQYQESLQGLEGKPALQWALADNALRGVCADAALADLADYVPEAVALTLLPDDFGHAVTETDLRCTIASLLGEHPRIVQNTLTLGVDEFFARLRAHQQQFLPGLRRYQELRQNVIARERQTLRLDEFKPRPLTSFVRNRLINDVYLGVIGDNLAKQMGTVGESKRSDLMGLLMLISPPGYGKTTLMEYVAHRLGLIFMKINGPALGHQVRSLDPAQAPDATSRQELEKLNLALEMGNNVMLYVDDIQHTHPEFLQKFISLCDGTRRVEGVWRGQSKTYDMRGRRFCVVMAGNPYTESGEVFKIPDMLANRADIYNLGDTLSGMQEAFALSYIENALTSNPVLAPLATRDMGDVYRFVARAQGLAFDDSELSHNYSSAEIDDITAVLQRMLRVRDVVLLVNQQYIASAAQADEYRTEPPFRLQGSYRNMNKMAEKISAVMTEEELMQLVADHYQGEAQLLTTGAEENLLKLAELRGNMTEAQATRWTQIRADYLRHKAMGGSDSDTGTRVVAQLHDLVSGVRHLGEALNTEPPPEVPWQDLLGELQKLAQVRHELTVRPEVRPQIRVEVDAPPQPAVQTLLEAIAKSLDNSFLPLIHIMNNKLELDLRTQRGIGKVSHQLRKLGEFMGQPRSSLDEEPPDADTDADDDALPDNAPGIQSTRMKTPRKKEEG